MKKRLQIIVRGAVQGLGFRPFIYRLAAELKLTGYVYNSPIGVSIDVEGEQNLLNEFLFRIEKDKPQAAHITGLEFSFLDPINYETFKIRESKQTDKKTTIILPDIALCDDCKRELLNPADRRFRYPFINCTNCGPRFSIIESLPYDRPNTSMKIFEMCNDCRAEYENPLDRRFHAQPIACPQCGPHIELYDEKQNVIYSHHDALLQTIELIKQGKIIALKGLGGYQIIADALNDDVVKKLRERKLREEKPFALMYGELEEVKAVCDVSPFEERLLKSPEAPIVILRRKGTYRPVSKLVAPGNPYLGIMLPYTPLHYLLMSELKQPIIATSGNISEEPMCITEDEAFTKLNGIADYFLVHNRPIVRPVDDSIVRVVLDKEMVTRRARGYAPFPIKIKNMLKNKKILAVGGHMKNTVALKIEDNVFISQHIGDLSSVEANNSFKKTIGDFLNLYEVDNYDIVRDLHPEYLSTKYAKDLSKNTNEIQHHYAHIASCRAENQIEDRTLGVSWDGTGYGLNGTVWGGEFFISDENTYSHVGQFKQFKLPGGEKAIKESRRSLIGILYEMFGDEMFETYQHLLKNKFNDNEMKVVREMLNKNINCFVTSSVGRLFDAVSSLLDISDQSTFEGQSAMLLEFTVDENEMDCYNFDIIAQEKMIVDWHKMILGVIEDISNKVGKGTISAKFHNTLAQIILKTAEKFNERKIVLSGGCFQNAYLTKKVHSLLSEKDFQVYTHQRVPPNDGGISLGQIAAVNTKHVEINLKEYLKQKETIGG